MYYDNLVNEQYMTKKLSRIIYQTFCALNKIYHFTTLAFELFWPYHNWISTRGYELKDLSDGSQSFCYIHCLWLESPFIILTRILSYPESSTAVHIAIFTTPATPICLRADRADSCIPPNFLEPLSKQASKPISTFKLIFWLLGHLLLKAKNPQVRQVQHLLHQEKRSSEPTAYLVNWLWTLQVLPCISQLMCNPEKKLPSYESYTIVQANSSYNIPMGHSPPEIKHNQVVVSKENRGEEGSKSYLDLHCCH